MVASTADFQVSRRLTGKGEGTLVTCENLHVDPFLQGPLSLSVLLREVTHNLLCDDVVFACGALEYKYGLFNVFKLFSFCFSLNGVVIQVFVVLL